MTLPEAASFPVIGDGKVFEATPVGPETYGGYLYALNASTGAIVWGPVHLTSVYFAMSVTYGGGVVYVAAPDGTVVAYSADTGRELWSQATSSGPGNPIYYDGVIYLQGSGAVYALSASTGAILWTQGHLDGDGGNVAVDSTGVYLAAACSWFRLSPRTGRILWQGNAGCHGGGGGDSFVADGLDFEIEAVGALIVAGIDRKDRRHLRRNSGLFREQCLCPR